VRGCAWGEGAEKEGEEKGGNGLGRTLEKALRDPLEVM